MHTYKTHHDVQSPGKTSEASTSDIAESTPGTAPPSGSTLPSIEPSGSSLPSFEPSRAITPSNFVATRTSVPVKNASNSANSATSVETEGSATLSPSGSAFPSSSPSNEPSSLSAPSGSHFPSTSPSNEPSNDAATTSTPSIATLAPSGLSFPSSTPSAFPVVTLVTISAPATVSIPCRSEMDDTTVSAFETATLDFITEYLPDGSGIIVTSVSVTQQTLDSDGGRLLRQRQLQEYSELQVDMEVEGLQDAASQGDVPVEDVIGNILTDNSQAFQDKLGGVTSFFRAEFAYAATEGKDSTISSANRSQNEATDNGPTIGIITGSAVAGLAAIVIAALLVVRYRKSHDEGEVGVETRQIDLLSWSTASPTSFDPTGKDANGFVPANANSPTDSEVYDDDDRYAASIQGRLSPIEEDTQSRLEDCDINTPRHDHTLSQATPQGTKFVQMDFKRSIASIKASKEKAGKILGDLENMEGEWEGQLDSKVDAVAETPKQNNLEKFKVGSRVHQC